MLIELHFPKIVLLIHTNVIVFNFFNFEYKQNMSNIVRNQTLLKCYGCLNLITTYLLNLAKVSNYLVIFLGGLHSYSAELYSTKPLVD